MLGKPDDLIVVSLPATANEGQQRTFLRSLASRMKGYRPRLVLDCSRSVALEGRAIYLVLCCLEEALKRNGDARLAGIAPAGRARLEAAGAERLFRIFASNTEAIKSFFKPAADLALDEINEADEERQSRHAA
jgi:anti-sigma B factor antagonist